MALRSVLYVANPYTTLAGYKGAGMLRSFIRYLRSVAHRYDKIYVLTMDRVQFRLSEDGRIIHVPIKPPPLPRALRAPYCYLIGALKAFSLARRCYFVRADGGTIELHAVLGAKLAKRPLVMSFRYFGPMYQRSKGTLSGILFSAALTLIVTICLRAADRIIALTELLKELAMKMGVDERKIIVIPILIREGIFRPERYDREALRTEMELTGKVIVFVGRLRPEKNVDVLIRAFKGVLNELGDVWLLIVGDGPLRPRLEALAKELNVADRTRFTGNVPREEVPKFLAVADVFVLPSSVEGLPKALLEAMAMSKPVVATIAPGIINVVKHRREAILVPVRDAKALKRALLMVLRDEKIAKRMAENARKTFEHCYSYEKLYPKLRPIIELYLTPYL